MFLTNMATLKKVIINYTNIPKYISKEYQPYLKCLCYVYDLGPYVMFKATFLF